MFTVTLLLKSAARPAAAATTALRKPVGAVPTLASQLKLNCRPLAAPISVVVLSCELAKDEICAIDRLLAWVASSEAVCEADRYESVRVLIPLTVDAFNWPSCTAVSAETWLELKLLS